MYPLIFGLSVTSLSLIGLHWFPWPKRHHAIVNYTLGVLAIFIGMTIWKQTWLMWAFPIAGGMTVAGCYLIDWLLNQRVKAALHESANDRVSDAPGD